MTDPDGKVLASFGSRLNQAMQALRFIPEAQEHFSAEDWSDLWGAWREVGRVIHSWDQKNTTLVFRVADLEHTLRETVETLTT